MTVTLFIVLVAGLVLLCLGLIGRRMGDEPRCAECLFDLSGQDDPHEGVCPECGADLSPAKATRTGVRRRRWGLATAGVLAMLPGLGAIGLFAYAAATTPRDQPTWYLLLRAEHGSLLSAGSTLTEIQRRYGARQLTDEQIAPIIERSLRLLVDDTVEWRPTLTNSWTRFASDMRRSGAFTEDQTLRFHGVVFEPVVAPVLVSAGEELHVSASLARSPRTSSRTSPFRRYVRLRAITVDGVRTPIESDPSIDLVALANTSDFGRRSNWRATAPSAPGVYEFEAEFDVFVPKACVDPATTPPQNLPNFIPQAELVRIRTVTSTSRVHVVPTGGVVAPATSDEAVEDARGAMVVLLFVYDGFERPLAHDESWIAGFAAAQNTEIFILPGEAEAGGEFSATLFSPQGTAFDLNTTVTIPARKGGATPPANRLSFRHAHRGSPIEDLWETSSGQRESSPDSQGWRVELTPRSRPSNERLLEAARRNDEWTPLPTLQRPITVPLTKLTGGMIDNLVSRHTQTPGFEGMAGRHAPEYQGWTPAQRNLATFIATRIERWPTEGGAVYVGVHEAHSAWLDTMVAPVPSGDP